jgi:hypothetical protein
MSVSPLTGNIVERAIKVLLKEGVGSFRAKLRNFWFSSLSKTGCYRRLLLLELSLEEPMPEFKCRLPLTIELLKKNRSGRVLQVPSCG